MDFLKALFEQGALTWEQFSAAVTEKGYKVADLSTGNYVSKKKYEDEIATANATITDLQGQIATRDTDLSTLKADLEKAGKAGNNSATTIADLQGQIAKLQSDYDTAKNDFEKRLASQQYEFAVKEFSNSKKFSSAAAKRDFEREMISANLKMKDKSIIGAEDFMTKYVEANADAIVIDTPAPKQPDVDNKPTFVQPTPPAATPDANPFNFNFMGVREH